MAADGKTGNRILDALPRPELERLQSGLEQVELGLKEQVYARGKPIDFVHFPQTAVVSLLTEMSDGRTVEVATIGNEGMAGMPVFLQAAYTSAHEAFAQIPGTSLRMRAVTFTELSNGGALHLVLQRYTQALFSQIAQSAACNRVHSLEQRCARWLLQTHDRVKGDEFRLTQEFLAQMLVVRRTSVSAVAAELQRRQLIRYSRGVITIVDRPGLEAVSCECYGVVAAEFERLLP